MSNAYDHQYYFAGQGCTCGTMVCASCNKPIHNDCNDWLAYKRDKLGDWGFVCHHRKCWQDQSGWEKAEKLQASYADKIARLDEALLMICRELNVTIEEIRWHIGEEE